jgi:chromosome segregation ATPase
VDLHNLNDTFGGFFNDIEGLFSMELEKFEKLEEKVRSLIEDHSELKKRNQDLDALLKRKDTELEGANSEIRRLHAERDAIRTKVDTLLDQLKDVGVSR